MPLLLKGICLGVGGTVHQHIVSLYLYSLTLTHRFYKTSVDTQSRAGSDWFQLLVGKAGHVKHNLNIAHGRPVVESYKLHVLVTATCAHPAHYCDFSAYEFGLLEKVDNFFSFHLEM